MNLIKMFRAIGFVLLSLGLTTCTTGQVIEKPIQIVDIETNLKNLQNLNLSQFTNDCRYIQLENVEGFELKGIFKYDISDSLILVSDLNFCLLYDINGKFISKIGNKGRGPSEFPSVTNIKIGTNGKIYLQSIYDLYIYNFDGSISSIHKRFFSFNNDHISSWLQLDDSTFFGKINRMTGREIYKALIFNQNNQKCLFNNYIFLNRKRALAGPEESHANIYKFQEKVYFKEWCNDTLFFLSEKSKLHPVYVFHFGKYSQPYLHGDQSLEEYTSSLNNYIWLENVFQTSNFLFLDCNFNKFSPAKRLTPRVVLGNINLDFNTTHALGIYNKQNHKLYFCKPSDTDNPLFASGLINDIDAGPKFFPTKMVNDSILAMTLSALDLKNHIKTDEFKNNNPKFPEKKKQLEELVTHTKAIDNPIIMFVTIKN